MAITLDASAAAAWLLPDESSSAADRLYEQAIRGEETFQAPALWAWETGNLLRMAERRGRMSSAQSRSAVRALSRAAVRLEPAPDAKRTLDILGLARGRALTFYDASYLELAIRTGAQLASKDAALRRAAMAEGVVCLEL